MPLTWALGLGIMGAVWLLCWQLKILTSSDNSSCTVRVLKN